MSDIYPYTFKIVTLTVKNPSLFMRKSKQIQVVEYKHLLTIMSLCNISRFKDSLGGKI